MQNISTNPIVNNWINTCLSMIHEEDQLKFIKEFENHKDIDYQSMHVFRELILGAYLAKCGFTVKNNTKFLNKTPDWSLINQVDNEPFAIVELANIGIDKKSKDMIANGRKNGDNFFVFWQNQYSDNLNRLSRSIIEKVEKYTEIVNKLHLSFVVSIFVEHTLQFDTCEIIDCLNGTNPGIFKKYQNLSGVIYFAENSGRYKFTYFSNENCNQKVFIPEMLFALVNN
jgi:hypothetical protein